MLSLISKIEDNINSADRLIKLERSGIRLKYAIDASVIHSYLNIPIDVYCEANKFQHDIIFFYYSSIALVIEHFPTVIQDHLLLLPFYEVELADNINHQKAIIKSKLNKLNKKSVFSNIIAKLTNDEVIAKVIHTPTDLINLSVEDKQKILGLLYKNFSEFYFYLIFNEDTISQQYTYISNNLATIPDNSLDIEAQDIDKTTNILFSKLNSKKNEPEFRYANYVDASSFSLVFNINKKRFDTAKEFLVLISDAPTLHSTAKEYDKEFPFVYESKSTLSTQLAPTIVHPIAILLYLLARNENNGVKDFSLNDINARIGSFRNKLMAGLKLDIETFFDQVFLDYIDTRMSSPMKLEEMQYLIKNRIIQKNKYFKEHVSENLLKILNELATNKDAWDSYRSNMINTFAKRDIHMTKALSMSAEGQVKAKYLIYGIYLFDYENEDINNILEKVTIDDRIERVLQELDDLKEHGIAEAYHLSAYIRGRLERFQEAAEDIRVGIKLCKSDDELRRFEYLRTINLGNKGLIHNAIVESMRLADLYGNDFPRFWLHLGFLYWQRSGSGSRESGDLANAIQYTQRAIELSLRKENKHYKCILLGEANLARYELESNNLSNAGKHIETLHQKMDKFSKECPPTEELPMFSYVTALYKLRLIGSQRKSNDDLSQQVRLEVGEYIKKCKDNLLIINKNARNEYMDLIDTFNHYTSDQNSRLE